jgi:hypothetical protein
MKYEVITVETPDDWFLLVPLLYNEFDMRITVSEREKVIYEVSTTICGRRPFIAVLENEFSYLWNENDVSIRWP